MQSSISAYLSFVYRSRRPKTFETYKQALQTFVDIVGDGAPLTKETYIHFLRKTSDMNPATQAICRSAIKGLYLFMADTDPSINTTFFHQADKQYALRRGKRLPIFDREAIEQIIEYCSTIRKDAPDLRDRAFILLLADTGLRISEACGLQVSDVDLREQKAAVIGKGNKQAIVNISNRAAAAITDYLQSRGKPAKSQPVFIRHDKKAGSNVLQVDAGGMWHAIKQRAKEAGVDPHRFRIHDFRHHFVTAVLAGSHDIKLAQELARHENIETTSRYAHLIGNSDQAYNEIFNH